MSRIYIRCQKAISKTSKFYRKWYISKLGDDKKHFFYLHKDGEWRGGMSNNGTYNYFNTRKEAREFLRKYRVNHAKIVEPKIIIDRFHERGWFICRYNKDYTSSYLHNDCQWYSSMRDSSGNYHYCKTRKEARERLKQSKLKDVEIIPVYKELSEFLHKESTKYNAIYYITLPIRIIVIGANKCLKKMNNLIRGL